MSPRAPGITIAAVAAACLTGCDPKVPAEGGTGTAAGDRGQAAARPLPPPAQPLDPDAELPPRWEAPQTGVAKLRSEAESNADRAIALMHEKKWAIAIDLLRHTLQKAPGFARGWDLLGFASYQAGDEAQALAAHAKAVELAPDEATLWGNYGLVLAAAGQPTRAVAALEKSLALDPFNSVVRERLTELGESPRQPAVAMQAQSPQADDWINLGLENYRAGDLAAAIAATRRALDAAPSSAMAYNNLGYFLFKDGQLDRAVNTLKYAVTLDPSMDLARNNYAMARRAQNKHQNSPPDDG